LESVDKKMFLPLTTWYANTLQLPVNFTNEMNYL